MVTSRRRLVVGVASALILEGASVATLADSWAQRRFGVCCFQSLQRLQPPAWRVVDYLVQSVELAEAKA